MKYLIDIAPFQRVSLLDQLSTLDGLMDRIRSHRPMSEELSKRIADRMLLLNTSSSAVTEGNQLNRRETMVLIQVGIVEGLASRDEREVHNMMKACQMVSDLVDKGNLCEADLRGLHALVTDGTLAPGAGQPGSYRSGDVTISASDVKLPDPMEIAPLVEELFCKIDMPGDLHPVVLATYAHWAISRIHPFSDGNGRVARLLQNYILLSNEVITAPLRSGDRDGPYYDALAEADDGEPAPLVEMVCMDCIYAAQRQIKVIEEHRKSGEWLRKIMAASKAKQTERRQSKLSRAESLLAELKAGFYEVGETLVEGVLNLESVKVVDHPYSSEIALSQLDVMRGKSPRGNPWVFSVYLNAAGNPTIRYIFWIMKLHTRPNDSFHHTDLNGKLSLAISYWDSEMDRAELLGELPQKTISKLLSMRAIVLSTEDQCFSVIREDLVAPHARHLEPVEDVGEVIREFFSSNCKLLGLMD